MQGPGFGGPESDEWGSGVSYGLSKSGALLEGTQDQSSLHNMQWNYAVYDLKTKTYTNISALPVLVNGGYSNLQVISMDDDGRILMMANHQTGPDSYVFDDRILLTPAGVSSNLVAAPEPASLAVMAMAAAAFAVHRTRRRG
jgi:hypothetical protein